MHEHPCDSKAGNAKLEMAGDTVSVYDRDSVRDELGGVFDFEVEFPLSTLKIIS